jgi:hypothetical protein
MAEEADVQPAWVLPAEIPFADLKRGDLEECVYWLLDAMGAKELEWRTGGKGNGAADGGRDLEAIFYAEGPNGEPQPQRWWIECKGRAGTVEPDAVKSAILNVTNRTDVHQVVIVTNTQFSNPTRDWVKQWEVSHPGFSVKLWDRNTLERLLSAQPAVVSRLFSQALSIEGRVQAVKERFWHKLEFSTPKLMAEFWEARATLKLGPMELFALIANECALRSIENRPWGGLASADDRAEALRMSFANLPYLVMRCHSYGIDESPITKALAYMIGVCLQTHSANNLAEAILAFTQDGKDFPEHVLETILMPVIDTLLSDIQDTCTADCPRFFNDFGRTDKKPDDYWTRFLSDGRKTPPKDGTRAVLQRTTEPCKVGFDMSVENSCPLFEMGNSVKDVPIILTRLQHVIWVRTGRGKPA